MPKLDVYLRSIERFGALSSPSVIVRLFVLRPIVVV